MAEEGEYPPSLYWRFVWQQRSKAKFFSPYRAIPSLVIAVIEFFWLSGKHPTRDLWIICSTICGVYVGFFLLNSVWNFIIITPVKVYAEQVEVIGELSAKNSVLEAKPNEPLVSPQEQRRRQVASEKIAKLSKEAKEVLRCIADHVTIHALALEREITINPLAIENARIQCLMSGLVGEDDFILSVKPEFRDAVDFFFSQN